MRYIAGLNVTAGQFQTSQQRIQNRSIWIELLNHQFLTVDELSGVCISGSITVDASADVRRTGSITLVVKDSSFEVETGSKIWLDKYIRIYVGTANMLTDEVERVNCGLFIIDAPNYSYDLTTNTLTLSLLDLMASLSGVRNGYLKGLPTIIKAGENIRNAIIDTLALGGITNYVVEEAPSPSTVPNDLEFSQGSTIYTILSGLKNIYPDYEMFFDVDGTFFYRQIPTGANESIAVDDALWDSVVLSENIDVDFQNVKNSIEVYGRIHEPAHFSAETTVSGSTIQLSIADVETYTEDLVYGFTLTLNQSLSAPSLQINSLDAYPIQLDNGNAATIEAEGESVYYCVQFKGTYWRWLGHLQAYGFAEDVNPQSPYYVEGSVGRIRLPLFDGDYANCITDDLAQQRAEYELWKRTNMNDSITLNIVPVYWLDVNVLVEYTTRRNNQTNQYIIKNLTFGLAPTDTATVNMIRYYPAYPNIVKER